MSFTASEAIDFTVSFGMSYQRTESTTVTEEESLTFEMTRGFEFKGIGSSKAITNSYSKTITNDTVNTFDEDVTESVTIPCKDKSAEGIVGVGLW